MNLPAIAYFYSWNHFLFMLLMQADENRAAILTDLTFSSSSSFSLSVSLHPLFVPCRLIQGHMVPLNMTQGMGKARDTQLSVLYSFCQPPSIDESDLKGGRSSYVDRYSCISIYYQKRGGGITVCLSGHGLPPSGWRDYGRRWFPAFFCLVGVEIAGSGIWIILL